MNSVKLQDKTQCSSFYVSSPLTFKCDYLDIIYNTALDKAMTLIKLQRQGIMLWHTHAHEENRLIVFLLKHDKCASQKALLRCFTC